MKTLILLCAIIAAVFSSQGRAEVDLTDPQSNDFALESEVEEVEAISDQESIQLGQQNVRNMEQSRKELEAKIAQLGSERKKKQMRIDRLNAESAAVAARISTLRKSVKERQMQLSQVERQNKAMERSVQRKEADLKRQEKQRTDLANAIGEGKKEQRRLEKKYALFLSKFKKNKKSLQLLQSQKNRLSQTNQILRSKIASVGRSGASRF